MNIVFICREYPPERVIGGIATYTGLVARGLASLGHNVHVICQGKETSSPVMGEDGVIIHRVAPYIFRPVLKRPIVWLNLYKRFVWLGDWWGWSYAAYRQLCQIMDTQRVDIVEAPDFRAEGFACSLWRPAPLIVKVHSPAAMVFPNNGVLPNLDFRLALALERNAVRRATLITTPSRAMADWVAGIWRVPSAKLHVLPNPIDDDLFSPDTGSQSTDSQRIILYVGRLERNKGAQVLLKSFAGVLARVPDARLRLVGSDNFFVDGSRHTFEDALSSLLEDERVRSHIEFAGKVPRSQLPPYYRQAAVCVFPTLSFDNFPYTCLEAMACGCPVIATKSGGMAEMIEHGVSGLLVAPGDVDALSEALVYLLKDRDNARAMGLTARQVVENRYTRSIVMHQTLKLYQQIMAES